MHFTGNPILLDLPPFWVALSPPNATSLTLAAPPMTVYRPRSLETVQSAQRRSQQSLQSEIVKWDQVTTLGLDIEDSHTACEDDYALPGQKTWYDLNPAWNNVCVDHLTAYIRYS